MGQPYWVQPKLLQRSARSGPGALWIGVDPLSILETIPRGGLARQETGRFPGGPLLQEVYRAPPCEAKNFTVLFLQYLCQTSLYSDNFWHTYTTINLLSPACFTFFTKPKSGNQLKCQQDSALTHSSSRDVGCLS